MLYLYYVNGQMRNITSLTGHFNKFIPTIFFDFGWTRSIHLPLFISDELRSFRFLTCDYRFKPMAYEELVNVYDVYVWLTLVISLMGLVGCWNIVTSGSDHSSSKILSLVKVLIEQGDPFP